MIYEDAHHVLTDLLHDTEPCHREAVRQDLRTIQLINEGKEHLVTTPQIVSFTQFNMLLVQE